MMAVSINFSKTLVGLMIDFSQVVMLTFVNGFQAAAFGNLSKAFGLTTILTIVTSGQTAQTNIQVMLGLLFGIAILSITASVLLRS